MAALSLQSDIRKPSCWHSSALKALAALATLIVILGSPLGAPALFMCGIIAVGAAVASLCINNATLKENMRDMLGAQDTLFSYDRLILGGKWDF